MKTFKPVASIAAGIAVVAFGGWLFLDTVRTDGWRHALLHSSYWLVLALLTAGEFGAWRARDGATPVASGWMEVLAGLALAASAAGIFILHDAFGMTDGVVLLAGVIFLAIGGWRLTRRQVEPKKSA